MKINNLIYILLAAYLATFLRLTINNNFFTSIIGSFLVGFLISKKLSYSVEKILLTGFLGCFSTFSSFIYQLFILFQKKKFTLLLLHYIEVVTISFLCFYLGYYLIQII